MDPLGAIATIIAALITATAPWWVPLFIKKFKIWKKKDEEFDVIQKEKQIDESTPSTHISAVNEQETNALPYSNQFHIASMKIPYVVIFGGWEQGINEYSRGEVTCNTVNNNYELPEEFSINKYPEVARGVEPKCRLLKYGIDIKGGGTPNRLSYTFSKVDYVDYLMSGEHLDDHIPTDPDRTFRNKYAPRFDLNDLGNWPLTNITGVGIFILTRDMKIIISKHSRHVRVWGNIWSYSASGTMNWNDKIDPFLEVSRECKEEIGHDVNLEDLRLFGFGIDAKKLYFQFSFFEYTSLSSEEILNKAPMARDFSSEMDSVIAVPFDLNELLNLLKENKWEPAASAGLITLLTKKYGLSKVESVIDPEFVRTRIAREMETEWEYRALRPGVRAVMSARYPYHQCEEESRKYVEAVKSFIGSDLDNKDVLEVGCGMGRITKWLVLRARKVTCLDISQKMIQCNQKYLGELAEKVKYIKTFGQSYSEKIYHDVAIVSLVLIHNVDQDSFINLVETISIYAPTIFIFEHTDVAFQVSPQTRPRTEKELLESFKDFRVAKREKYKLFNDNLIFLKLIKDATDK